MWRKLHDLYLFLSNVKRELEQKFALLSLYIAWVYAVDMKMVMAVVVMVDYNVGLCLCACVLCCRCRSIFSKKGRPIWRKMLRCFILILPSYFIQLLLCWYDEERMPLLAFITKLWLWWHDWWLCRRQPRLVSFIRLLVLSFCYFRQGAKGSKAILLWLLGIQPSLHWKLLSFQGKYTHIIQLSNSENNISSNSNEIEWLRRLNENNDWLRNQRSFLLAALLAVGIIMVGAVVIKFKFEHNDYFTTRPALPNSLPNTPL